MANNLGIKEMKNKKKFHPFRLISNDEYSTNMNAIIAYYQMSKGETKKRFVSEQYVPDTEGLKSSLNSILS